MTEGWQVGWVEAIAALLFITVCVVTQWVLQRFSNPDRGLEQALDHLSRPRLTTPPKLTYREADYELPSSPLRAADWTAPTLLTPHVSAAIAPQIPNGVVRLTYRGVPYIQLY